MNIVYGVIVRTLKLTAQRVLIDPMSGLFSVSVMP